VAELLEGCSVDIRDHEGPQDRSCPRLRAPGASRLKQRGATPAVPQPLCPGFPASP
jgi:hypothetical protein